MAHGSILTIFAPAPECSQIKLLSLEHNSRRLMVSTGKRLHKSTKRVVTFTNTYLSDITIDGDSQYKSVCGDF
jgi:hypothetical protein